jgi:hypothetical protein
MKRVFLLLYSLLFMFLCDYAQRKEDSLVRIVPHFVAEKCISIINSTSVELTFELSFDKQNWQKYTIKAMYLQPYEIFPLRQCFIRLYTTKEKCVKNVLEISRKYKIDWDTSKLMYIISEIK